MCKTIFLTVAQVSQEKRGNILGGHSIGHSKQKSVYVHVSYSEPFPRYSYFTVQYTVQCTDEQHAMSSYKLQSAFIFTVVKGKVIPVLNAPRREGVWGSGCIGPHFLDFGTIWE
jgi:hypothetical protein